MNAKTALIAAFGAILFAAAPAAAADMLQPRTMQVDLAGVDVTSSTGARIAEARIAAAVDAVCGRATTRELSQILEYRACRTAALKNGREQLAEIRAGRMVAQNR